MFLSRDERRASTERSIRALRSALSRGADIRCPFVRRFLAPRGFAAVCTARAFAAHARMLRRFGDRTFFVPETLRALRFLARIAEATRCSPH